MYCGVDFNPRQQTVAFCHTADGEIYLRELDYQSEDVMDFYSRLKGEVVGIEASGYSKWFVELIKAFLSQVLCLLLY